MALQFRTDTLPTRVRAELPTCVMAELPTCVVAELPTCVMAELPTCVMVRLPTHVMAGLDPAISRPHQIANDAIPVSDYPTKMVGLILDLDDLDVVVRSTSTFAICATKITRPPSRRRAQLVSATNAIRARYASRHQPPIIVQYSASCGSP